MNNSNSRSLWLILGGGLLVILITLLLPREHHKPRVDSASASGPATDTAGDSSHVRRASFLQRSARSEATPAGTAEEIVASKVRQFGRSRLEIVRSIGRRLNKDVPPEIEKFFSALEAGNWEELDSQWRVLATHSGQYEYSTNHWEEINPFWPAVLDAYGVAEQAHDWPAQKLLDYGTAILDSLRPGMVYVGGTDNGRWIPELLNETSGGESHIIVTQNAFADARYLEYMSTLYGDRLATLTTEDSQRAFQEYLADAQKRLQHDQEFPDEPKQVRPGESIKVEDGRVQVSGQVAVMTINEKLLQALMQKNPDFSFAMQESFPMKGTYADAVPLGPIMELRADGQNTFTAERVAQSLDYWRTTTQALMADPTVSCSPDILKAYSHDAVSAANLLASHNFNSEAGQAYRLASELAPSNLEAVTGLSQILFHTGRAEEARRLLDDFAHNYPKQRKDVETFRGSITFSAGETKQPLP